MKIRGLKGSIIVDAPVADLRAAWKANPKQGGLTVKLKTSAYESRAGGTNCDAETERAFRELGAQVETRTSTN